MSRSSSISGPSLVISGPTGPLFTVGLTALRTVVGRRPPAIAERLIDSRQPDDRLALYQWTVDDTHYVVMPRLVTLSRTQLTIERSRDASGQLAFTVIDDHSCGGTFVNDERISRTRRLSHGDEIQSGGLSLRFSSPEACEEPS